MYPDRKEEVYMRADGSMVTRTRPSYQKPSTQEHPQAFHMLGDPITDSQRQTIKRIENNLPHVRFTGSDKYEAYQFIQQWMESSRVAEDIKKQEEAKQPSYHCHACGENLKEEAKFYDLIHQGKYLCFECYKKRSTDSDWVERTEEVDKAFEKAKRKPVKAKRSEVESTIKSEKRGNRMLTNLKSIMGEFGKITTDQFKLSFQGVAVRTEKPAHNVAASYAVYDKANNRMIDVMDFVLDAQGMLFKLPVLLNQLQQGDIILVKEKPLVVKSVNVEAQSIRALNPLSNNETTHKPAGNLFGFQFITKVTSMFELMQGGQQMNPFMMLALAGDKEDSKLSELLPFMMMGGMQGGANPMAQMLPLMMLSGKDGGSSNMMEMMMMSQMFGGGFGFPQAVQPQAQVQPQQAFGFGNLFGGQPQQGFNPFAGMQPVAPVTDTDSVDSDGQDKETVNDNN